MVVCFGGRGLRLVFFLAVMLIVLSHLCPIDGHVFSIDFFVRSQL